MDDDVDGDDDDDDDDDGGDDNDDGGIASQHIKSYRKARIAFFSETM